MNWSRGLFRLWVLLAALWTAGWLILFSYTIYDDYSAGRWQYYDAHFPTRLTLFVAAITFLPPAGLLVIGAGVLWALRVQVIRPILGAGLKISKKRRVQ